MFKVRIKSILILTYIEYWFRYLNYLFFYTFILLYLYSSIPLFFYTFILFLEYLEYLEPKKYNHFFNKNGPFFAYK